MKEIAGNITKKLDLKNFRHVSDLIYYEGPLLSYFQDKEGESYLFSWVDCDDDFNRWLIIHTSFMNVIGYIRKELSLRKIILDADENKLFLVDIDSEVNYHHLKNVRVDDLPAEYIPATDKLYDYEPQNSEPEFLKKLKFYGRKDKDGPLKLIGRFDSLNAKTGLYRFEDMYSLDTSYGYFVKPNFEGLRHVTLSSCYIVVVDRKGQYNQHKAADKIISVEPVFSD